MYSFRFWILFIVTYYSQFAGSCRGARQDRLKWWLKGPCLETNSVSHHDACVCFVVVRGMHALKPLLTSSVPEICESKTKTRTCLFTDDFRLGTIISCGHWEQNKSHCTIRTDRHCFVSYRGCVFVESQSIGWQLLGTTAERVKDLNLSGWNDPLYWRQASLTLNSMCMCTHTVAVMVWMDDNVTQTCFILKAAKGYYSSMRYLSISLWEREIVCVNATIMSCHTGQQIHEALANTHLDLPTALSPRQMIFTCSSVSYFFWSSSGMLPTSPAIFLFFFFFFYFLSL